MRYANIYICFFVLHLGFFQQPLETLVTSLFGENTRVASRVGRGLKRIRRRVIRIRRPPRGGVD